VGKHSSGLAAVAGYAILLAFGVCYLKALPALWSAQRRRFWTLYAALIVLCAVETLFAHEDAFVMCVFIAVQTVGILGNRAWPTILALTLVAMVTPRVVPSWHADFQPLNGLTIPLTALAMWGFFGVIRTNQALADARSEVARLAAENERTRIARDLHDLLGHSLTTITVKAGLARRLAERGENERAAVEIAEVEELSRRSLADVRAAVAGHREVTLAGEIATAREVLRAAGVVAELPGSVDVVDPSLSELFGWVAREGVTNVVRHARAAHCAIRVDRNWIEIVDDGRGGVGGAGNGLTGLRERVEAAGGTVRTETAPFQGWRLRVEVPRTAAPRDRAGDESTMSA
jgi:two-component system, NarL family, sensor histidine kinase DesK